MSFMDKIKSWIGGNKDNAKRGIDSATKTVQSKVGAEHADKVDSAADKAKDAVDKLPE